MKIGRKSVGDGYPCFITFEAGPTHAGYESARRLIEYAAEAGADAVKFQIFDPDRLIADRSLLYSYEVLVDKESGKTEVVTEPLYDIFVRRYLPEKQWKDLKLYADELGLEFFATVGDEDGLRLIQEMGCSSVKIASADVNHFPFLRLAARSGLCIQLDTGNASFGEIEAAVDLIQSEGDGGVIIHNCPTGYPARLESINLRMIPSLKSIFGCPVAYSDHTPGWEMDIAAVAMGANLVEKTITEDRCTRSVEHIMSIEPADMMSFVRVIRDVEAAMGVGRRVLSAEEKEKRLLIRRSAYVKEHAKRGQKLSDVKVEFRRPGYGIAPDMFEAIADMTLKSDLEPGHLLSLGDLV